jgi:hypothetical protein
MFSIIEYSSVNILHDFDSLYDRGKVPGLTATIHDFGC